MSKDNLLKIYLDILINETKDFKKMQLNAKYVKYISHIKK